MKTLNYKISKFGYSEWNARPKMMTKTKTEKIIAFGDKYEVNFNENISSKAAWARIIIFEVK